MLPEFLDLTKRFEAMFERDLRRLVRSRLGPGFSQMRQRRQFEGKTWVIQRPGAPAEPAGFKTSRAGFKLTIEQIANLTMQDIVRLLNETATEMAEQIGRNIVSSMDATLEKHGRTMDSGGQPMSAELLLKMLESIEMAFEDGGPNFQLHVHPDMLPKAQEVSAELFRNPELNQRYRDLLDRKWEEWRAREIDRSLDG
jgi:hypothetical protein